MSPIQPSVAWRSPSSGLSLVVPVSPSDQQDPTTADAFSASPSSASRSLSGFGHDANAPAAGPSNTVKTGRTPSRYDWTKHMDTIKRLYIDEDRTLKEVLEIMERDHNFVATAMSGAPRPKSGSLQAESSAWTALQPTCAAKRFLPAWYKRPRRPANKSH
ncbi:hypothetical protein BD289DRAFT_74452 [Coniella lustricola]|uniref:Clr5 domain-containing protein n=1 Tax=Coniella lustricola TaxID=2025994 RepID=A0A2T3AHP6_9PEZI|nr:hypothetical protein BD289DRAFT_74452 [Coniella lustricola]